MTAILADPFPRKAAHDLQHGCGSSLGAKQPTRCHELYGITPHDKHWLHLCCRGRRKPGERREATTFQVSLECLPGDSLYVTCCTQHHPYDRAVVHTSLLSASLMGCDLEL